jgi:Zn-finger nucleic acid-binding protein
MKCPLCAVDLVMADRQGIEIDYCPKCRGIWLDRGEIDKIIERSQAAEAAVRAAPVAAPMAAPMAAPAPAYQPPPASAWVQPQRPPQGLWKRDDDDDDDDRRKHGYPKKRKGFLSEILDFD